MRTLRVHEGDRSELKYALLIAQNEAEAAAALWFSEGASHWMFRDALHRMRLCHDLRVQLTRAPERRTRTRRTH